MSDPLARGLNGENRRWFRIDLGIIRISFDFVSLTLDFCLCMRRVLYCYNTAGLVLVCVGYSALDAVFGILEFALGVGCGSSYAALRESAPFWVVFAV